MMENYFETEVIRVEQPLGQFFVAAIPARVLLETTYSKQLWAIETGIEGEPYRLEGAQRAVNNKRLKDIGLFIDRNEAAFPNSIILAPNFHKDEKNRDNRISRHTENEDIRWRVEPIDDTNTYKLVIPKSILLAQIVDGQHRLFGFNYTKKEERLDCELLCSIFMDLPEPMQAQLFATINSTQKQVDRSQTYELFGYNIEEEEPSYWGPDKLAVYLTRRLNADENSLLKNRVLVSAENDFAISRSSARKMGHWVVSFATVVDGILKLITRNVEADLSKLSEKNRISRKELDDDRSPLRSLYLDENDKVLYRMLINYFSTVNEYIWNDAPQDSFILRTVGFQALFEVLYKHLSIIGLAEKKFSEEFFRGYLSKISNIDFSDRFFVNASGSGRIVIRNCIEIKMGFKSLEDIKEDDRSEYARVCSL